MTVNVAPQLFPWARERAHRSLEDLTRRFPKLPQWESGVASPTLRQLEKFAKATFTPVGFFFLAEAPAIEKVPIPDFRTARDASIDRPSAALLDTIYACERRQEWFRDEMRATNADPLRFIGSATIVDTPEQVAGVIRRSLRCDIAERANMPNWSEALRSLIANADALGILVMVNGVVGNNTHRKLDPAEFRGFALADNLAPLIFVNGADSKSAQMFTIVHEAAHLWLGTSSLDDVEPAVAGHGEVEDWCNEVAAEVLVPLIALREVYRREDPLDEALPRLTRYFKVSGLVVLRRLHAARYLSTDGFWNAYRAEVERQKRRPDPSGGNFYATEIARVGKRFSKALCASTLEGRTLYRDAFSLLAISKTETFNKLGRSLGFEVPN